jgi:Flp pilus assembly pilin Flp
MRRVGVLRTRRDSEGASAVEFALLLPIFIALLFGIMYGSSLFNTQQTVTQSAREGARFGATLPLSAFGSPDETPPDGSWFAAVRARAESILVNDAPLTLGNVAPSVCVVFTDGTQVWKDGLSCPSDTELQAGLTSDTPPRVQVITGRPAVLELGVTQIGPLDLSATGIARFEGVIE